jgi:leucyl aminopeptidase
MKQRKLGPIEFVSPFSKKSVKEGPKGTLVIADKKSVVADYIKKASLSWQVKQIQENQKVIHFLTKDGPVWILHEPKFSPSVSHNGKLEDSHYSFFRDQVGALVPSFKAQKLKHVHVDFQTANESSALGTLVGIFIASYSFKEVEEQSQLKDVPSFSCNRNEALIMQAKKIGDSVNLARHLVNLPPNALNPSSFAELIQSHFRKHFEVEVWDSARLEKENMNLHLAVGKGAQHPPCLIRLKYRPQKSKKAPMAFVGKGITFDSGGYDLKPSSAMRLMKKDMGGAACLAGVAHWMAHSNYSEPADFYFAMAENMVDQKSFRPSDVYVSRSGLSVEIHNTDAEGRLVLADALDVAVTQSESPSLVIDVATLTGAIKVALGADIAGLFSNDDALVAKLEAAAQQSGDLLWRMPLVSKYTQSFSSSFADMVNAVDGFGGAITAALFLEKFCKNKPWAHLDVYAWNDKPHGPLSFAGGSGQSVQALIWFLRSFE